MPERWYYGPESERKGPFSKAEIRASIENGTVTPYTHLTVEGETQSYEAVKTEFGFYFPPHTPLVGMESNFIADLLMWVGSLFPLAGALILYYFYFQGVEYPGDIAKGMSYLMFAPAFFVVMDLNRLSKAKYRFSMPGNKLVMLLLYPYYLYYRNRLLRRGQAIAAISLICCLLSLGMYVAWPFYKNREVADVGQTWMNRWLYILRPEIVVECTNAHVVSREPSSGLKLKFKVTGKLSNGKEMTVDLIQSMRYLGLPPNITFSMPEDIGEAFLMRIQEKIESGEIGGKPKD